MGVDQELKPLEKKISDKILRNCFSAFCVDREAVPRPVYTGGGWSYCCLPGVGGGRVEKSAKGRTDYTRTGFPTTNRLVIINHLKQSQPFRFQTNMKTTQRILPSCCHEKSRNLEF